MDIETKFIEMLEKIEAFAVTDGYEAVLATIQLEAFSNIIWAITWAVIGYVSIKTLIRFYKDNNYDFDELKYCVPTIISCVGAVTGILTTFLIFFDTWLYVALLRPELYLVHTLLSI